MNRDTIYSFGIFYAPKGTQLTLPKSKDARYQSAILQTDHYIDQVLYGPGTFEIDSQTEFSGIAIRSAANFIGIWANASYEVIYFVTTQDAEGQMVRILGAQKLGRSLRTIDRLTASTGKKMASAYPLWPTRPIRKCYFRGLQFCYIVIRYPVPLLR
jgi:hypothetical protein